MSIGTAGEQYFSAWCSSTGITANKSTSDEHGWDVFLEMHNQLDPTDALSMHEPIIESKVQIKSTDGGKRSVPVTLSNLRKMATTPLPAFYVLLSFGTKTYPESVHVIHIDNELTRKILGSVRKPKKYDFL